MIAARHFTETIGIAIDAAGVLIIAAGILFASYRFLRDRNSGYLAYRRRGDLP